jgi:capsid protein
MNMFDRAIATLSPKTAVKREVARKQLEVLNSGYSNYGASFEKKSMVGWNYGGGSSREDVEDNLPQLRERCRDLYMGVPLATGALKTYRTSVIGAGLTLKPKVDYEALRISEQQAEELEKQINREWNLWSDSVDCDAARLSNFYELQQLAFLNWTMSGDVLMETGRKHLRLARKHD